MVFAEKFSISRTTALGTTEQWQIETVQMCTEKGADASWMDSAPATRLLVARSAGLGMVAARLPVHPRSIHQSFL